MFIIWKSLVGKCLQCVKETTNSKVDKNVLVMVRANSHGKGEVIGHVQQKSP